MELKGRYAFQAPADRVWNLLMDTPGVSACLPGCEAFEPLGDDCYRVRLTAGIAAISGTYEGTVAIRDKQPGASYRLILEGRGRTGFLKAESTITLTEDPTGVTVAVNATAHVGGLIAQVGQRLIATTGRVMMDRVFDCLRGRLQAS